MRAKKKSIDWASIEEAYKALQPFYEPGDDGDSVRLALDAIASVLAEATNNQLELEDDEPLRVLLEALKAPPELTEIVEELYEAAAGGSYGEGMSEDDAKTVNGLVEDMDGPLRELLQKTDGAGRRRAKVARKKRTKPR